MVEHGFGQSDNNLFQEIIYYSNRFLRNETYNKKMRLKKPRTLCYANTVITLLLILSGDIPGTKQKSPTCLTCNKTVRSNSKNIYCAGCL